MIGASRANYSPFALRSDEHSRHCRKFIRANRVIWWETMECAFCIDCTNLPEQDLRVECASWTPEQFQLGLANWKWHLDETRRKSVCFISSGIFKWHSLTLDATHRFRCISKTAATFSYHTMPGINHIQSISVCISYYKILWDAMQASEALIFVCVALPATTARIYRILCEVKQTFETRSIYI